MATTIKVLNLNTGNEEDIVIKSPAELSEATKKALDPTEILTIGTVTAGATPSASFTGRTLNLVLPQGPKGEPGADGTMTFEDLTPEQRDSLKGDPGDQGAIGPRPAHEWDGTILKVQNPDGSMDAGVDLRGEQGIDMPDLYLADTITAPDRNVTYRAMETGSYTLPKSASTQTVAATQWDGLSYNITTDTWTNIGDSRKSGSKPDFNSVLTTINITENNSGSLLLNANKALSVTYTIGDSAVLDVTSSGEYTLTINGVDVPTDPGKWLIGLIAVGDGTLQIIPKKVTFYSSKVTPYIQASQSTPVEESALNTLLSSLEANTIDNAAIWPLTGDILNNKLFNLLDPDERKLSVYEGVLQSTAKGVRWQGVSVADTTIMPHASHLSTWPDVGITFYMRDYISSLALVIRSTDTNAFQIYTNDGGNSYVGIGGAGQYVTLNTAPRRGLWTIQRYQGQINVFLDGVKIGSAATSGSDSSTANPIRILYQSPGDYQELSFISIHEGMDDSKTQLFHTSITNYITSLNRQV